MCLELLAYFACLALFPGEPLKNEANPHVSASAALAVLGRRNPGCLQSFVG